LTEAVLDANVLLRYLTDEPRELADRAITILDSARSQGVNPLVTSMTVAEVVYVLESVYEWPREVIAERLTELILAEVLTFPEQQRLIQTLAWYREFSSVHFADAYVAATATSTTDQVVISFDRGLRRIPGLRLVQHIDELS